MKSALTKSARKIHIYLKIIDICILTRKLLWKSLTNCELHEDDNLLVRIMRVICPQIPNVTIADDILAAGVSNDHP
jgi:hypothetical protein